MDDKPLQPSTTFDHARSPTHQHAVRLTFQSTFQSTSSPQSIFQSISAIHRSSNMDSRPDIDAMGSLISPPEATPYESFSRASPEFSPDASIESQKMSTYPKTVLQFLSPPVSPETKITTPDEPVVVVKDPILYPNQDPSSTSSPQQPLFPDNLDSTQQVVDEHISARALRKQQFREASPPPRDDYILTLEFKSQVYKACARNPAAWLARERQYLLEDRNSRKKYAVLAPSPSGVKKSSGVVRSTKTSGKSGLGPRGDAPTKVQNPRPPKPTIASPHSAQRPGQPSFTTREDKHFMDLPDYSPPLSTLPNRPNSLKVEWKGSPLDLRYDEHRHLLHPDEIALAGALRLDCATYLTSKRRIFIARIECLRIGKEFRKTDSQQACKIDVNKASKLWAAFEKVGWLKAEYFRQYL